MKNNYFEGWIVKRIGSTPTAERVGIYCRMDRYAPEWDGLECYTIFPTNKAALLWRNHWKNKEDFEVFKIKIPNIQLRTMTPIQHQKFCGSQLQKELEVLKEKIEVIINRHSPMENFEIKEMCATDILKEIIRFTRSVIEEAMPEEKAQLDKNDPDNYGACYAIGGFNDCRAQFKQNLEKILKDNEKEKR